MEDAGVTHSGPLVDDGGVIVVVEGRARPARRRGVGATTRTSWWTNTRPWASGRPIGTVSRCSVHSWPVANSSHGIRMSRACGWRTPGALVFVLMFACITAVAPGVTVGIWVLPTCPDSGMMGAG